MSSRFTSDELRELEQRLSDGLEAIAPRPRGRAVERVLAEVAVTPQRRGLSPWIALRAPRVAWTPVAAVAVVVVAALAVGIGIGASGVLNAARSPQPSASFGATWRAVQLVPPETAATDLVSDGYAGPNRIVLVGQRAGPKEAGADSTPAAWYSDDGITWHDSKVNVSSTWLTVSGLGAVFPVGDRLYAIGGSQEPAPPAAPVFESTDGGATWNELPGVDAPVVFRRVTTGGPGLVAVSGYNATVWTSADGRSWTAHSSEGGTTGTSEGLHAVAAHGSDLLAVGQVWHQSNSEITGLVLTSPDGEHWTRQTPPQDFVPLDVTWAGGAWLMTGYGGPPDGSAPLASILRSTDGVTWNAVPLPGLGAAGSSSSMEAIAAGPDGIVAIGGGSSSVGPSFSAWTSTDGSRWQLHAMPEHPVGSAQAVTAVVRSGQIIVAGNGWTANRDRLPAVWVSPASTATATSAPTSRPTPTPAPTLAPPASPLAASPVFREWSRIDLPDPAPDVYGGTIPQGIVRFGDQWIGVGGVNGGCCDGSYSNDTRGVIWMSRNGLHWTLVPPQPSLAHARIRSVTTDGKVVVAVGAVEHDDGTGQGALQGAAWYSTDGTTWHMTPAPWPETSLVALAGDEFVAVSDADQRASFYASSDGRSWSLVAFAGPGNPQPDTVVSVLGLAGAPNGSLAAVGFVGVRTPAGDFADTPTVWSGPGLGTGLSTTSLGGDAIAYAVVARDGGGWLAAGIANDASGLLAWSSEDGTAWSAPAIVDGVDGLSVSAAGSAGAELILAGSGPAGEAGPLRTWILSDGTWLLGTGTGAPDGEVPAMAWDANESRIVAVGTAAIGSHPAPAVWIASR